MTSKVAVVDDDKEWGDLLLKVLKHSGFDAVHFMTPGRFLDSLLKGKPDMMILDMCLPGMHGRELIRVLRSNAQTRQIPIIAISGQDTKSADAVKALEAGADEYLSKPLDQDLLIARLSSLLRRSQNGQAPSVEKIIMGPLSISIEERIVTVNGKNIDLTHLEFDLLTYMIRQSNRVLTRSLILEMVWGGSPDMNTRTVDKHVETLRRKLGSFGKCVETVIRVGYILKV